MTGNDCIAIPLKVEDLSGHKYGQWTVIQYAGLASDRKATWLCECKCGTRKVVRAKNLRNAQSCDCGCGRRQKTILRNTTHGRSRSPEHRTWCGMIKRCYNQNNPGYEDYGGRGITVCDRWKNSFESFLSDMGVKPFPEASIGRIDNDGNYEPNNCRWETYGQQAKNTRRNRRVVIGSDSRCFSEWAKEAGVTPSTFTNRVEANWNEDHLLLPPIKAKQLELNGKKMTVHEWSAVLGMSPSALYERLSVGWTTEEALSTPPRPKTRQLTFRGKTQSLFCWAEELGINRSTLCHRLNRGWSVEKALSKK